MKENDVIICPDCKGKRYKTDYGYILGTLGMAWLMSDSKYKCTTCKGKGFVKVEV